MLYVQFHLLSSASGFSGSFLANILFKNWRHARLLQLNICLAAFTFVAPTDLLCSCIWGLNVSSRKQCYFTAIVPSLLTAGMCRGGQVRYPAAMLQTRVCVCSFQQPVSWQWAFAPTIKHWENTCFTALYSEFKSGRVMKALLMWKLDPTHHCCIQGNGVISWGVLASSHASPSSTPTADLSLWRAEFTEGCWSFLFVSCSSAGHKLEWNACCDAAVRDQFWTNEADLMASTCVCYTTPKSARKEVVVKMLNQMANIEVLILQC